MRVRAMLRVLGVALIATWPARVEAQSPAPEPLAPAASEPPAMPAAAPGAPAPSGPAPTEVTLRSALRAWGCEPIDVLRWGERWYAACGTAGVFVVAQREDQTFGLIEQRQTAGEAYALFARGAGVWVESRSTEARPLQQLPLRQSALVGAQGSPRPRPAAHLPGVASRPEPPRPGDPPPGTTIAPGRAGGIFIIEGALRPFLPLKTVGFGVLADPTFTYRGERPWYAQVKLYPFGGLLVKGRDAGVLGVLGSAGYDHQYFALGLGAGVVHGGEEVYEYTSQEAWRLVDEGVGFAVTQSARLGAVDGLHAAFTNAFVLDDERWRFGFVDVLFQVPIGRQTWILAQGGGGGHAGFFYAEVGLRRLVRGRRGSGSLFVRPTVGAAGIDTRDSGAWTAGPMIGCHLEWRQ